MATTLRPARSTAAARSLERARSVELVPARVPGDPEGIPDSCKVPTRTIIVLIRKMHRAFNRVGPRRMGRGTRTARRASRKGRVEEGEPSRASRKHGQNAVIESTRMHPRTEELLQHLDKQHERLRRAVEDVPPERRETKPHPERRSVAEVLEHL